MMQFLLNAKDNDIPMKGVDWIILTANAIGLAIVISATVHANAPSVSFAQASIETEIASLN
ncbi:MAG: hypothetical protein WBB25_05515 [Sulfitobacter sp.]